jgi:hypothetical protein
LDFGGRVDAGKREMESVKETEEKRNYRQA